MRRIQAVSVSIGLSDIGYGTSISVLRSWPVPGSIEFVSIFLSFFSVWSTNTNGQFPLTECYSLLPTGIFRKEGELK
jgi:hypothetical protein